MDIFTTEKLVSNKDVKMELMELKGENKPYTIDIVDKNNNRFSLYIFNNEKSDIMARYTTKYEAENIIGVFNNRNIIFDYQLYKIYDRYYLVNKHKYSKYDLKISSFTTFSNFLFLFSMIGISILFVSLLFHIAVSILDFCKVLI